MSVFKKKDKSDDKKKKHDEVDNKSPQGSFQPAGQSTSQGNLHSLASSNNNGSPASNGSTTPTYTQHNSAEELERTKKEEDEKRKQAEHQQQTAAAAAAALKKEEEEKQLKQQQAQAQAELERKKRDEEIRKTNAANANSANKELNEQVEISSLEQMGKLEPSSTVHDMFSFFPTEVYNSYEKLQYFSRDLNTSVSHPEIVFVGPRSSGKSSLIEAFIGRALNIVSNTSTFNTGCSKRVVYFQFSNNSECDTPKVTIKKDNSIKEFDHDIVVTIEQLNENLAKRNQQGEFTEEPIYICIESKTTLNLTLIDSPGLLFGGESNTESNKIESIVSSLLRPSHRLIIAVESCNQDWKSMNMTGYLKKIDPELSRSTFVFTKFFNTVRGFSNTRDINKYLSGTVPDIKPFFVTLPSDKVRASYGGGEPHRYQEKIYQAHKRDMHALEQLQYDKRYERSVGVAPLRKYILNIVWKSYQDTIPRILKHLRSKRQVAEATLNELQKQSSSLDSTKLRSIASNYTVTFLQITEKLLSGTSEGNPSANGQTLEEEKSQQGDCGEWVDAYKEAIYIDPEEWNIPYWSSKLYGGQQLERLMSEFKAVCDNSKISEVKMDDIATASGINKLNNIPNYSWAASDLTAHICKETFAPLIEQLCERAMYVMKRLTDIADKVIESRKKSRVSSFGNNNRLSNTDLEGLDQYPFFTHHVKNLYYDFVHRAAKGCKEKCMDEFYSSRTIYWELTEHPDSSLPNLRSDHNDTKTAVSQLATKLFDSIRQRITKNVLLKLYNFFLVPMQTDLWNEIQAQITCLSNEQLEQLFEVQATREQLKEEEKKQQLILEKYSQIDEQFLKASSMFCRPMSSSTLSA